MCIQYAGTSAALNNIITVHCHRPLSLSTAHLKMRLAYSSNAYTRFSIEGMQSPNFADLGYEAWNAGRHAFMPGGRFADGTKNAIRECIMRNGLAISTSTDL